MKPRIVKVQTDMTGTDTVLVYAQGHKKQQHQFEPALARSIGPLGKRYHYASVNAENGQWLIGRPAPEQGW